MTKWEVVWGHCVSIYESHTRVLILRHLDITRALQQNPIFDVTSHTCIHIFTFVIHIFARDGKSPLLTRRTKVIWQKAESLSQVHVTPRLYSPGGSIVLTVWQFGWGSTPQISLSPWHNVSLDPTSVPAKWQLNPSNGLSRVHECDRRQTDRPRIACAARAIPLNNTIIYTWSNSQQWQESSILDSSKCVFVTSDADTHEVVVCCRKQHYNITNYHVCLHAFSRAKIITTLRTGSENTNVWL